MSQENSPKQNRQDAGVLQELARSDVKLISLLVDGGEYFRQCRYFLKSPLGRMACVPKDGEFLAKPAVAFMLQGILLAFVLFTLGQVVSTPIASLTSTQFTLAFGSVESVAKFVDRVNEVQQTLPPELREMWRERSELSLVLKVLPENTYRALIEKVRVLGSDNVAQLRMVIRDPFAPDYRSSGRAYVAGFFLGLNDATGPTLLKVNQVVDSGTHHKFRPHIGSIVRRIVLWYVACLTVLWVLRWSGVLEKNNSVFWMGAYVIGFFAPIVEFCRLLLEIYLSLTLVPYVLEASVLMLPTSGSTLAEYHGGIFPYENLLLGCLRVGFVIVMFLLAARAMSMSVQRKFAVLPSKAWFVAASGIGLGLAVTEAVTGLLELILAPTGLV